MTAAAMTGVLIAASAGLAPAAPCPGPQQMGRLQLDRPQMGPWTALSAPQSIAAQLHRQPTTASVAAAERRLEAAAGALRKVRPPSPGGARARRPCAS